MVNTPSNLHSFFNHIEIETIEHKKAMSYSNTIHQLFGQIIEQKMPADRIVSDYFRANKKHGSKDRKVIRESIFSLFRWWGWMKQFGSYSDGEVWHQQLATVATLESHPWHTIISAWVDFSKQPQLNGKAINSLNLATESVIERCNWLNQLFDTMNFTIEQLVPQWFWDNISLTEPHQCEKLINSLCNRPPIWGRIQNISTSEALNSLAKLSINAHPNHYFKDAVNLGHKNINLTGLSLYRSGQLELQDLASQVIGQLCAPQADENWWDCCSGAGGKTLQLTSLMLQDAQKSGRKYSGSVTASDIRIHALKELKKRATRAKFDSIKIIPWQSEKLPVAERTFDGVLVDAPCSCTGTWRRNPDMRWLNTVNELLNKPALQLDILSRASRAVKIGGKLIYATCSLSPLENEQVVEMFLTKNPNFSLVKTTHPFTQKIADMQTIWPEQADSDGMFIACMTYTRSTSRCIISAGIKSGLDKTLTAVQ